MHDITDLFSKKFHYLKRKDYICKQTLSISNKRWKKLKHTHLMKHLSHL